MLSEISAHAEHVLLTGSAVFGARNHHNFLASLSVKRSIRIERSFGQRIKNRRGVLDEKVQLHRVC